MTHIFIKSRSVYSIEFNNNKCAIVEVKLQLNASKKYHNIKSTILKHSFSNQRIEFAISIYCGLAEMLHTYYTYPIHIC